MHSQRSASAGRRARAICIEQRTQRLTRARYVGERRRESAEAELFHANQALELDCIEFTLLRTLQPGKPARVQTRGAHEH